MKKTALTHTPLMTQPRPSHLPLEARLEDSLPPQPFRSNRDQAHQQRRLWRNKRQQLQLLTPASDTEADKKQQALNARHLPVYFAAGEDRPSATGERSLRMLGFYLCQHPQMAVRLDGYADPRGTDEYNNVLAHYRTQTVAQLLIASGVDASRISCHSHGGGLTLPRDSEQPITLQEFANERRVEIRLGDAASAPTLH